MKHKKLVIFISITLIAISSLIVIEYFTGRLAIGPDQAIRYSAASQIAAGEGLTRLFYNEENLAEPIKQAYTGTPPGLSISVSPLFVLFNDAQTVHVVFVFLNLILFLFLFYKLFNELAIKPDIFWLSLIFLFFSLNGVFLLMAGSNDFICLNIFILSSFLLIRYYKSGKKRKYLLWICFLLPITFYFRYAYLPALFVLPAFFGWRILFYKTKEVKELLASVVFTVLFAAPFIAHIVILNLETGYVVDTAVKDGDKTFYWANLIWANPFPMNAFFDQIPLLRFISFEGYGYDRGYDYPFILHVLFYLISAAILIPVYFYYRKLMPTAKRDINSIFGLYAFVFSIGLILLIYLVSLINPSLADEYNWSWSKVFRYFMVPAFFIQVTYFLIVLNSRYSKFKKFAMFILASSLIYSVALKTYNYIFNYKTFDFAHNTSILRENNSLYNTYNLHLTLQRDEILPGVALIDNKVRHKFDRNDLFLAMNGITTTFITPDFDTNLKTSGKVNVYIVTDEPSLNTQEIINRYNAHLYKKLENDISVFHFVLGGNGSIIKYL